MKNPIALNCIVLIKSLSQGVTAFSQFELALIPTPQEPITSADFNWPHHFTGRSKRKTARLKIDRAVKMLP